MALYSVAEIAVRIAKPDSIRFDALRARAMWVLLTPDLLGIPAQSRDFMSHKNEGHRSHLPNFSGTVRNPTYDSHRLRDAMDFTVHTNTEGFRNPPFSWKKPKDEYWIACLGDSWAFGWGVNDDETYCYQLGKILRERFPGKKITAINFGVSSSDVNEVMDVWNQSAKDPKPDLVVFTGLLNDAKKAFDEQIRSQGYLWPFLQFMSQSRFANWVSRKINGADPPHQPEVVNDYADRLNQAFSQIKNNDAKVVALTQTLAVPAPVFSNYRRTFNQVAEKQTLGVVDAAEIFKNPDLDEKQMTTLRKRLNWSLDFDDLFDTPKEKDQALPYWPLFADISHPNEAGHLLLASQIADLIEPILRAHFAKEPIEGMPENTNVTKQ